MRAPVNTGVGVHDFTRFDDVLEGAQIVLHLLLGGFAQERGDSFAEPAAGRIE